MSYCIDLARLTLTDYRELLRRQTLLPGRRMLQERIDERFRALEAQGISTVAGLKARLSSPAKLASLADLTGLAQEYLALLRRELGSLEQKPAMLSAFAGVDAALLNRLEQSGIRSSQACWEAGAVCPERLTSLCDLVRINGVGPAAAAAFYDAGYRSVADVAAASAPEMLRRVTLANEASGYYRAKLGEKDMQFCIDFAGVLLRYS